jgi:hypothetical protein
VRAYSPRQHTLVTRHVRAADDRLRAASATVNDVASALLLREALRQYVMALEVARDARVDEAALEGMDPVARLPALEPDALRPTALPTDEDRVRAALANRSPLYFDELPAADAAFARIALERMALRLGRLIEARSVANVTGTRIGRLAAIMVVLAYVALVLFRATLLPKNVALGQKVHASTIAEGDPRELVDGNVGALPALRTGTEDSPSIVVDLGRPYRIDRIAVHNRGDGWFDDCLPLVAELSADGMAYVEIARREQHFGADPPWSIRGRGEVARFVRLRLARRGYLALSEVEVYGRKPDPQGTKTSVVSSAPSVRAGAGLPSRDVQYPQ